MITIFLFDSVIFDKMESWSGPIVIGLVQLILLVVLARRLGIQEVSQILAKFLDRAAELTHPGRVMPPAPNSPTKRETAETQEQTNLPL
jgi:hypothetical protein